MSNVDRTRRAGGVGRVELDALGARGFAGLWGRIERRPYLLALIVFGVGWLALCTPWLTGAVTIPYDAKAHFQAQIQFLYNSLASGQSPFWNPNAFAGQPQVADPQSLIFSPAILLALLGVEPSFQLVDAFVFGLLGMGGVATLLLFREMRWPAVGAVVAAFAFSFGASAALRVQHVGQVQSLAFLMVAHWLLVRTFVTARRRDGALMGLACAMMIVEPDQVALLGAYVLAFHVAWRVLAAPDMWVEARRLAAPLVVGGVVCVAIAAAPLALTWLFVESTTRAVVPFAEAARGSLHPASLLTGLVADLFGAIDGKIEYWGPFSDAWGGGDYTLSQNMGQIYIGAVPALAIILYGVVGGRAWDREVRFFSVVTGLMLIYALGAHTALFRIAYDVLPGVSGFRRPADATFLMGAYGAVLGGYLVARALEGSGRLVAGGSWRIGSWRSWSWRGWSARGVGPALCVMVFVAAALVAWSAGRLGLAAPKLVAGAAWCGAAALLLRVLRQRRIAVGSIGVLALASLMVVDLWANNGPNESTALPPAQFDVLQAQTANPTIGLIKRQLARTHAPERRDRVEIVGVGFHWTNAGLVHDFENILGYNPLRLDLYSHATGAGDQAAGWDQRRFSKLFPSYHSLLADMLGVRLIVSGAPIDRIDTSLLPGDVNLVARTADAYVYENPRALPRVMFTGEWRRADFAEIVDTGHWPKFDPRATVLLDVEPQPVGEAGAGGAASSAAKPVVQIISYENTRVEIDVETTRPGFVVLNDIYHPWWRAQLDDKPVEILQANVLFRAVQVGAGRHRLVFTFDPVWGAFAELKERVLAEDE